MNTITSAAKMALLILGRPATIEEIYLEIVREQLYTFGAKNPRNVLYVEINRHCIDTNINSKKCKNSIFMRMADNCYWLSDQIDKNIEVPIITKPLKIEINEMSITLLKNDTAPITRWWVSSALKEIQKDGSIFSFQKLRIARTSLIAGSNRVKATIKNWMIAANLIISKGNSFEITDGHGLIIIRCDPQMEKAASWWSFHINVFFSVKGEPYGSFFNILGNNRQYWLYLSDIPSEIVKNIEKEYAQKYEESSIGADLDGIYDTFTSNGALADLHLIEIRKDQNRKIQVRLGTPKIPDEAIIYGLILARKRHAPSAVTINFDSLLGYGLHHALCLSAKDLRERLRAIYRDPRWTGWFRFEEGNNMNSIYIDTQLTERNALLRLLQDAPDTWF